MPNLSSCFDCLKYFKKNPVSGVVVASETTPIVPKEKSQSGFSQSFWIKAESAYNFSTGLLDMFVSNAALITFIGNLPRDLVVANSAAVCVSLPLSIALALASAYAHYQTSMHFANKEDDHHHGVDATTQEQHNLPPATLKQKSAATLHYIADILEGASMPLTILELLAVAEMIDPTKIGTLARIGVCSGTLLFSAVGNKRGFDNNITAAREGNAREALRSSSPGRMV